MSSNCSSCFLNSLKISGFEFAVNAYWFHLFSYRYILHRLSYLTVLAPLLCNALEVGWKTQIAFNVLLNFALRLLYLFLAMSYINTNSSCNFESRDLVSVGWLFTPVNIWIKNCKIGNFTGNEKYIGQLTPLPIFIWFWRSEF